ncbi:MAG: zf-TFIIB domain-containing protein [Dehalococcoidales bacterium]|nr:zf-TFIIB domain-containing protein [Dehalococcoidales bacterium]
MICPVCQSDMIVVEHNRIELDYCAACHGVWFDAGELELLLGSLGLDGAGRLLGDIPEAAEVDTGEEKRRCPFCRRKMKKVDLEKKVLVDLCPQGEGIWFDGGEVGELIGRLFQKTPHQPDVLQNAIEFLGEVIKPWE